MSSQAGEPEEEFKGHARDYHAREMAAEAQQALRSHEAITHLQFKNVEQKLNDLKDVVDATGKKVDALSTKIDSSFAAYNNKIIGLLSTITLLLAGGMATMVWWLLTHGKS